MADEKKKATKKAGAAKAAGEKAAAKEAESKKTEKKAPGRKAAKKATPKKAPAAKKDPKEPKAGKEADSKEPATKAAPKKAVAPNRPSAPPVVRARARYVRIAPRKARLIADQVRGMHIERARALLQFSPRSAAADIRKLIESAAANAENNHDLIADEMKISSITVDEGPTLKRFRPRALGRATPIHKRTSHIAVALTPTDE